MFCQHMFWLIVPFQTAAMGCSVSLGQLPPRAKNVSRLPLINVPILWCCVLAGL